MFWKQKRKKSTPSKNRIDDLANKLQQENKIDRLETELFKFDPTILEGDEKESWYHLYGIIPFRQGNRDLAFQRFQEGIKHCPDSAFLWFSLGQEYEFRAETDQMFRCFDRAKFPKAPAQYALAQARYAYLWNQYEKAISYVEPLISVYFKLKILDDTFLYIRGIPFFSQTWAYLAAFHLLIDDLSELKNITTRAEAECSNFDFAYLKAELKGIESGDFSDLMQMLERSVAQSEKNNWPSGYHAMRLSILKSQGTYSPDESERMLDAVTLNENDFPWLNDMRLLAKCELAHRLNDSSREDALVKQFVKRQQMLFEPDNAINFNLLKYQENLKGWYQENRKTHTFR
jgi:tetratricopeptide (TPR) repeat protein